MKKVLLDFITHEDTKLLEVGRFTLPDLKKSEISNKADKERGFIYVERHK